MAKSDMKNVLKQRIAAAQQATELQVGEAAYTKLLSYNPSPIPAVICDLSLDKLVNFFTADIGFKPYPTEKLTAFAKQLATEGLLERIIVRPIPETDTYEILAGHNRTAAAKLNGWSTISAEIVEVDDNRAVVIATSTNLLRRQGLTVIERGKAYKALLEAKNRNSQYNPYGNEETFGDNRQRYNAQAIVAEFFGVTEYEIRKAVKLTLLIPALQDILVDHPKQLNLACADLIADYSPESQEAFVEICSVEGSSLNKTAMNHIRNLCPPPTADRQALFSAWREDRALAERRKAAPPKSITFRRKNFQPYLDKLGNDKELERLFLEFLREKVAGESF